MNIVKEMKLYVFFCFTIKSVGGAQLYIRKKMKFLQDNGWTVKCVYPLDGDSYITDLCHVENLCIKEIHFRTNYYFWFKRDAIVKRIIKFIGCGYDNVIIESHNLSLTSWGEVVSQKIGARHLVYNINEKVRCPRDYFEYYSFKCNRRELKGITLNSIPYFFSEYSHHLDLERTLMRAYGASESILDVPYNIPYDKINYTIGIVGRLEKEFVKDTLTEIGIYLNHHKEKTFNVVYVGGELSGNDEIKENIRKFYIDNHKNVNLYFTGYIFPIPKCLVKSFDVCISGAGAAREVTRQNVPTITIDPRTMVPNGVLSIDTHSSIFNEGSNAGKEPLSYYLEQVYKFPKNYVPYPAKVQSNLLEHLKVLEDCSPDLVYHLKCFEQISFKNLIKSLLTQFFPTDTLLKLGNKYKKNIIE